MASSSPVDSFWATFTELKKILYRNISLLALVLVPLTYQIIIVEFLIEEQAHDACNQSGNCLKPGSRDSNTTSTTGGSEFGPESARFILGATQYLSMLLGTIVLGLTADIYGRLKTLFPSLLVVFLGGLTSAFCFKLLVVFTILRCIVGFASGGAFPVLFVLAAEYVDPTHRAVVLGLLWTLTTFAIISLAGIACIVESRQLLMISMTLPLLLVALLWKIVPESPRWVLLNSARNEGNEAQVLLQRLVSEDHKQTRRYSLCWTLWGHFDPQPHQVQGDRFFTFLRRKEPRRIALVVGFAWFSIGMLFRGLNTSSIQLLSNFYGNYAVRELVNLLGFAVFLVMVTWVGRRFSCVVAMVLGGVVCVIFSVSSNGFLLAEHAAVTVVIQFVGRVCVLVALSSLSLYSIELFPTIVRCSAVGLVTAIGYLGIAATPLIMRLQPIHPVVPLGVMGCFSLTTGILCQCLLPKTKGKLTAETFDDVADPTMRFKSWSPKAYRRRRNGMEDESQNFDSKGAFDDSIDGDYNDEYADLRQSWEVSFDRASVASKWEMLSYEDARITPHSVSNEQILDEDSNLLSDRDIEKMAKYVPSFTWVLVYSTFNHGMSLKTLYHRLREVETPVLLVVKDNNGFVFGVMSPIAPKMAPNFSGFGKSFFFTCKPNFKVFPCSGKNSYYMTGDNTGLAFGCSEGNFGLWLDNELYHGRSTACDTYNSEMLSATEDFLCHGVEVWTFT